VRNYDHENFVVMKTASRNTKLKATRSGSLELVQNGSWDVLENKIIELLKSLQDVKLENSNLRNRLSQLGVPEREKEIEEKENIIRRQQVILKSKEAAFQELQEAFRELRRQHDTSIDDSRDSKDGEASAEEPSPHFDTEPLEYSTRDRIRAKVESVILKLDQLEKMIH
jgi:regulator of replication initiation timing